MRVIVDKVRHRYSRGARWALDGVDLELETGACVTLMGASGSGKSTLLSVIAGLLVPTEGEVRLSTDAGMDPRASPVTLAAQCAWVFQAGHMLPRRTAGANVALAALARGESLRSARSAAIIELERVGLGDHYNSRVEELSGGEVQRVGIARAFAGRRPVIVADEPTGQLDRANTLSVGQSLVTAATAGRIVVVATHDQSLAALMHRTVHLVDGRVSRIDESSERP